MSKYKPHPIPVEEWCSNCKYADVEQEMEPCSLCYKVDKARNSELSYYEPKDKNKCKECGQPIPSNKMFCYDQCELRWLQIEKEKAERGEQE
jgi:predicted RNA-binding protein with PUA-like domain